MSQDSVSTVHFSSLDAEITELLNTEDNNMAEQQQVQQLNDVQRKTILDHVSYHERMISVLKSIEANGKPVELLPRLPKRPGTKLDVLLQAKKKKQVLSPEELHNYLCTQVADTDKRISVETFSEEYFNCGSEAEMITKLQKGFRNLMRCHAQTLMICIQFGRFLNKAKEWHSKEYEQGILTQNWAEWLKANTGYSDQHARKLREVAKFLGGYEQFWYLGLSFNWIYSKKTQLQAMLKIPKYHEFWIQPFRLPAELPQSQ